MVAEAFHTNAAATRGARFLPRLYRATRDNVLQEDISEYVLRGTVELDLDLDGAQMAFLSELKQPLVVQPFTDFVAPFLRIVYGDGTITEEQVGLFCLVPSNVEHYPSYSHVSLDGRDLRWLLAADHAAEPVDRTSGTNIITAVLAELSAAGLTRTAITPSTQTFSKDTSHPPGTSRLQRINDYLHMLGYYSIWFDRQGVAHSRNYIDLATAQPDVTYTSASGSQIVPPINEEPNMERTANRVVVIGTDPAAEPIVAFRENVDPLSPVSYPNLGFWLSRTVEDPAIDTQEAADALADDLIRNGAYYYRTLHLRTLPDPTRNPREVYALDVSNPDGTVASGNFLCSGWVLRMDGDDPVMDHTLARVEAFTVSVP